MTRAIVPAAAIGFVDIEKSTGDPVSSYRNTIIAANLLGLDCRYDALHDRFTVNGSTFGTDAMQVSDAFLN